MARQSSHPALSYTDSIAASWSDFLLLVGRICLGWLFLVSGWAKLGNIAGTTGYFKGLGLAPPEAWAYFAGAGELVLGAALILGIANAMPRWYILSGIGRDRDRAPLLDLSGTGAGRAIQ